MTVHVNIWIIIWLLISTTYLLLISTTYQTETTITLEQKTVFKSGDLQVYLLVTNFPILRKLGRLAKLAD